MLLSKTWSWKAIGAVAVLPFLGQLAACGGGADSPAMDVASASTVVSMQPTPGLLTSGDERKLRRVTQQGAVLGIDQSATSGTYAWLGLPYAKPPVGALRWMPPAEPDTWSGTRHVRAFGASCVQGGRYFSPPPNGEPFGLSVRDGLGKPVGEEDCLTLNIWRPSDTAAKLPVIVFIHGGSNISGYSADPLYNGASLSAKAHALVVTINYRLGLMGWLDLPQLKTGDPLADSGNFATLDHIQALKYLHQNVEAFGGDPGNVTVMGESAGAVNTWALMVSPLSKGLMHKAVSMSGGLVTSSPAQSRAYAKNLLQAMLVDDGTVANAALAEIYLATRTSAQVASYMRSKSAKDIIRVSLAHATLGNAPAVLTDGAVIPLFPSLEIARGNYRQVPMLAGNTAEEGKLFGSLVGAYKPNDYDRFTMQYNFDPDAPSTLLESDLLNPQFLPVDRPVTGWNSVSAALTAAIFTQGTISSMGTLSLQQPTQMWYYRFDWAQEPAPFHTVYGSAHAMDIPFVFGNFGKSVFSFAYSQANKPGREVLSDAMMRSIGSFAATGNPNHSALGAAWPNWPATLVFDATPTQPRIGVQ